MNKNIKIKGGLGNQMFQYAYGRNLMITKNKNIIFNISFFDKNKKDTNRFFLLNNFKLNNSVSFDNKRETIISNIIKQIYSKITGNYGFYQSEKYFKDIENIIREEFTLKNPLRDTSKKWEENIDLSPISVSIHIRRGDYVSNPKTNKYHGLCDVEYYKKAIELLENKIGKEFEIFVFSDDIDWAKNNLSFNQKTDFVSSPEIPDYEEMYLMSLCKHNIIANSTFSWWGAWLNKNPDKIVIAPEKWNNKYKKEYKDLIPPGWIKI
jgi:hypothetical protein